jgi:hypothetical protein
MRASLIHGLDGCRAVFRGLAVQDGAQPVFLRGLWHAVLAETCLETGEEPLAVQVEDSSGRLLAALPLYRPRQPTLVPAIAELDSLANAYTCLYQPLLAPGAYLTAACRAIA